MLQMMIATDTGYVLHCSRFSHLGNASPATYHSSGPNEFLEPLERARHMAIPRDLKFGTSILSLHYCPTDPRFFAAAYNDGTISLFKTVCVCCLPCLVHITQGLSFTANLVPSLAFCTFSSGSQQ